MHVIHGLCDINTLIPHLFSTSSWTFAFNGECYLLRWDLQSHLTDHQGRCRILA